MNKWIANSLIILPFLYAGILFGVSFFATSIKFSAPLLTLPIALDIGKVTFNALIKLEWLLSCTCLITLLLNPFFKLGYVLIFAIIIILFMQTFWLLPILDERIILLQQGHILEESFYHWLYIALDFTKLISLLGIALSKIHFTN